MERKQQIRAELKKKRDTLTRDETRQLSAGICDRIESQPWFLPSEVLYFYYPLGNEVNLLPLAEKALTLGKQIAFPRVSGMDMDFYQVSSLTEFEEGNFHVMEPIGAKIIHRADALVLVPGLGFDSQGGRMGYGKGYYDRYFSRFPECHKVGIAYAIQLVKKLPGDAHDVPMDEVITENGLIKIS